MALLARFGRLSNLLKARGFVFPGSEIHGGLAGSFDYGPLGVQLKKNIQDLWWHHFVTRRRECVGLDSSVLMSPRVWEAAGHLDHFVDPLTECSSCHRRHRADKLVEEASAGEITPAATLDGLWAQLQDLGSAVSCPSCGANASALTPPRDFNMLFESHFGAASANSAEDCESKLRDSRAIFRPETAQGAYVNFVACQRATRKKLPFGIGQSGRSFRNEISPGNFIFRTREFDQLELQWFCEDSEAAHWYEYWVQTCHEWLLAQCGLSPDSMRLRRHANDELAHYARATTDIEFDYPFGWGELWGIADRGDHDLCSHSAYCGEPQAYRDAQAPQGSQPIFPTVIEPALGLNRLILAMLWDAYDEGDDATERRTVLHLPPRIAPITFAVLPLAKKPEQIARAEELYSSLSEWCVADVDLTGSIGKRYRRQDEIGTPWCVTVDYDTEQERSVTVRARDSMRQVRLPLDLFHSEAELLVELEGL